MNPQHVAYPMAPPWPPFAQQYFPTPPPAPGRYPKRALLLTAAVLSILLIAVLLILGFGAPGFFLTRQLDVHQAQAGIERVLVDPAGYRARNVDGVVCNGGRNPTIKKGTTFTCEATIDSVRWQFPVRFTDNAGSYEIGQPQ
ncbi:hypothetical protein A9W99_09430 [Mycobacterium sp. 1164966.3]|uniref:DUF4333 domain-containing protein n=1 Tax=Mycobacterium sp. 1164966.3 TaxID=1856861 RepID=UPI0007FE5803|nr:DUF4333 domain-containing protein [Mycobacterium sp. 1164966.3]OBA82970.1 hypothetical protein A9W99_09430 [Mycobacterium sp. 1164966.3]